MGPILALLDADLSLRGAYGHSSPLTTRHYVDDVDAQDMADAYARSGIPGFAARTRKKWSSIRGPQAVDDVAVREGVAAPDS